MHKKEKHYNCGSYKIECIKVISGLNFYFGNIGKYIWRAPYKNSFESDINKSFNYLKMFEECENKQYLYSNNDIGLYLKLLSEQIDLLKDKFFSFDRISKEKFNLLIILKDSDKKIKVFEESFKNLNKETISDFYCFFVLELIENLYLLQLDLKNFIVSKEDLDFWNIENHIKFINFLGTVLLEKE